jgi:hypothetical protein
MSQNIDAVIADGSNGAGTSVADQILARAEARRIKAMQNGIEIAKALNTAADSLGWDDEEVNRNLKILLDNKMDLDIIAGMEDKTILAFNLAYSLISRVKSNHVKFQTNMMLNPHMAEVLLRQTSLGASQLLNNVNNIVAPSTPPTAALETRFPSFSGYPMLATPNTSLEEAHPKPEIENDRPTKKQKLTGLTKESIEQKIRKNQRIMDSFPEGAEFEVISESKFFCKLCKSTIKIHAGDISGITEHCYGKFSKGSSANNNNNNNGKTSKHWARVLALKDGQLPAMTKIGKLQRKNRREESQKQGKVLCYCLQDVGMVQGKKGLLFRCSQVNRCPFKRRAESDINALSDDDDIDEALQVEEQQHLHMDSAMNLMFTQLLQQQASYINHSNKTE